MVLKPLSKLITIIFAASFFFGVFGTAQAVFNPQINYQGKLVNATTSLAVDDDDYNMEFKLCAAADCAGASDPLWTETRTLADRVAVANGLFSVLLGSVADVSAVDFNQTLYLEVSIGGILDIPDWETLAPRKKLGAVPAAFEAKKLDGRTWEAPGAIGSATSSTGAFTTLTANSTTTFTGNVGIGISVPTQKLDIAGKIAQNGTVIAYLPDQTNFTGSLILGDGGLSLSHSAGNDGRYDTFIGLGSGNANTTGEENTAVGYKSLYSNTTGYYNTAVGYQSLHSNTEGQENTALGKNSLYSNTAGYYNAASGLESLYSNTEGSYNSGFGYYSLKSNQTGSYNTAVGMQAGNGVNNNSFSNNSLVGYRAGFGLSTGSNNILLGYRAGDDITTGANNILLGYDIDAQSATGSNQLSIGNLIFGTGVDGTAKTVSSGNIGIGVATPGYKLDVNGTFNAGATSTFAGALGIKESGDTPTYYTYFTGGDQAGNIAYTLPAALPGTSKFLRSTSAGILSWEDAGGGGLWTASSTDIYYTAGNVGIGTAVPGKKLDVLEAASNSQLRISQSNSVYSELYLDSAGDLRISATGGDIRALDENMWVCAGGACPSITPSGNGNLVVEGGVTVGVSSASCDASNRGTMRVEQGAAGVTDKLWSCMKTSADGYNWVLVARGD